MKQLVINADDFGICVETNTAIETAYRRGILTSASLMVTTPAWHDAIDRAHQYDGRLGVGLHLSLSCGVPAAPLDEIPLLVDRQGCFRLGFVGVYRLIRGKSGKQAMAQIEREFCAQLDRMQLAGLVPDHIDSHQHVHMIPDLFGCVLRLAADCGCPVVRLTDERLRGGGLPLDRLPHTWRRLNPAKKVLLSRWAKENRRLLARANDPDRPVCHADGFVGLLSSGRMDVPVLRRVLGMLPEGVTEVATHPSLPPHRSRQWNAQHGSAAPAISPLDRRFLKSPDRQRELDALLDTSLREDIQRHGIRLTTFRQARPAVAEPARSG